MDQPGQTIDSQHAPSDAQLVARSVHDPRAFDQIYRRHVAAIFAFAAARVGPTTAEDVTAETFAAAFAARTRFNPDATSARPWLYGIAVNMLHRHHAAEQRWIAGAVTTDDCPASDDDVHTDRLDAHAAIPELAAALAELTPAERDVLVLHVFGELTHREIAVLLGIRRGTAKVRLSRGRDRLRRTLHAHHVIQGTPT